MKKVFITMAMVLVCFQCVSFAGSPAEDEKILSQEKALSVKLQTVLNADDALNIIRELSDKEERQSPRSVQYSKDINIMKPLLGTTWIMNYRVGSTIYSDVLIFGTQATTTSDGSATLSWSTQSAITGWMFYTLQGGPLQSGQGFAGAIMGTTLNELYYFTIDGNVATGLYQYMTISTGSYSSGYPLTGIKWGGLPGDINGDGKLGLEEIIRILQIISGLRP